MPTAPTALALNNSTQLATTAYADAAVSTLSGTVTAALALKAPLVSPALTGTPTSPTATSPTNDTQIATTAFANTAASNYASAAITALLGAANTWTATQTFSNGTYSALFTGGNVGIGTTVPVAKLQVVGNIQASGSNASIQVNSTGSAIFQIYASSEATDQRLAELGDYGSGGSLVGRFVNDAYSAAASWLVVNRNSGTYTVANVLFPNGNVGIGTAGPGQALTVVDAGNVHPYSGTLSVFANNLSQGVGIGYAGISAVGGNANQDLNFDTKGTGTLRLQTNSLGTGSVIVGSGISVGIGAASPSQALEVNGNILVDGVIGVGAVYTTNAINTSLSLTAAYASGISSQGQIQSTVTGRADGFVAAMFTAAGSYTIPRYDGFQAQVGSIGAGSAVSVMAGYHVDASFVGATSVSAAFNGEIPAGTNQWNLYMNGTAPNYLAGPMYCGDTGTAYGLNWQGMFRKDQNAVTQVGILNSTVGTNAQCQLYMIGGTGNSYLGLTLVDNNGSPYADLFTGAAVTSVYYKSTAHQFYDQASVNLFGSFQSQGLALIASGYLNFNTGSVGSAGYGIRDNAGTIQVKNSGGSWASIATGGTVTSVGLALPASILTVSGSPVTAAGTLTATLATQTANTAFLGPASGAAAAPTFRSLVAADIPNTTFIDAVTQFGFIGDDSTDNNTVMAAFVTYANTAGNGTVFFFRPGKYRFSGAYTFTGNNITLMGVGQSDRSQGTWFRHTATTTDFITFSGSDCCSVERIFFSPVNHKTAGAEIKAASQAQNTIVRECRFFYTYLPLYAGAANTFKIVDCYIQNVFGPYGILCLGTSTSNINNIIMVEDSTFNNPYPYSGGPPPSNSNPSRATTRIASHAYALGDCIAEVVNGYLWQCTTAGTTGSGAFPAHPAYTLATDPWTTTVTDGTAVFKYICNNSLSWLWVDSFTQSISLRHPIFIGGYNAIRMVDSSNTAGSAPSFVFGWDVEVDYPFSDGLSLQKGDDVFISGSYLCTSLSGYGVNNVGTTTVNIGLSRIAYNNVAEVGSNAANNITGTITSTGNNLLI